MLLRLTVERWRLCGVLAAGAAFLSVRLLAAAAKPDNPADDAVGTIEGEAIALQGPMSVEVVHGQVRTVLRSGNDIRVKSGQAHLDLVEGGKIAICGPAHLSVLKSGGSLTLALDTGTVRLHIDKLPSVTIYTAQIQAKPIAIGDGAQDAVIGFDAPGMLCVRALSGAIRLEQQLTGQSVIVPQGGDIILNNGALEGLQNTTGHCACEMQLAKNDPPPPEISRLASTEEIHQRDVEAKRETSAPMLPPVTREKPAAVAVPPAIPQKVPAEATTAPLTAAAEKPPAPKQEAVYQVFMPPLAYDSKAAVQNNDFDPKLIVLVRRVRVRPTLIFQGRVEGDPAPLPVAAVVKPSPAKPSPAPSPPAQSGSVVNRVRDFLRNLFS